MSSRFPTETERARRRALDALLDEGLVYVHLDARRPGVVVPDHLAGDAALVLKLSHRFHLDTFEVGPLDVTASLSFGGQRFCCVLPYEAMFAFSTDEQPFVAFYPDAAPEEVTDALAVAIRAAPEPAPAPAPEPTDEQVEHKPRPVLRLVK